MKFIIIVISLFAVHHTNLNDELFNAVETRNIIELKSLLKNNPNLNIRNEHGDTLLVQCWFEMGFRKDEYEVAKLLIEHGADPNFAAKDGTILLNWAFFSLYYPGEEGFMNEDKKITRNIYGEKLVMLLLDSGSDINHKDNKGKGLIEWCYSAVNDYDRPIIDLLIQKGADVNNLNLKGENILFKTIEYNDLESFKYFVGKGAKYNIKNKKGKSLIKFARENKRYEIEKFIMSLK
ncbi:MAG TPA: hypothetical protein PLE16_08285 [Spirochaetota bacterium]|nr:hypothetical protein [Spirochaetota bacterium]HOH36061.1 hypothetical protein [Spirochaetota bacterium]HPJ14219.1 hypothetical protein [Spirochaetota bacterium]HPM34579.1 hypothetical protein [Spirochaetota bacterium]HPY01981.1 hypothetical protein [Spirochaetota bacterium]